MKKENKFIRAYKSIMKRLLHSYDNNLSTRDIEAAIEYSIEKRYNNFDAVIKNNYTGKNVSITGTEILDYISSREPIVTSYGVLFKRHDNSQNPMLDIIRNFANLRKIHKKEMFKYPKYSEMFEYYNLLQSLDKIDMNGIYGLMGLAVSFLFDLNVAPSITSTGRSLISSAIMCFEMFLGNNVQFSSLEDILVFIDNVRTEYVKWKYDDNIILGREGNVDTYETFTKLIMNCGYKYVPDTEDLDIVYRILQSCNQTELNRIFYKNNLYCMMDLPYVRNLMVEIFNNMEYPYMNPMEPPTKIKQYLDELKDILLEYVFYCYQLYDRMDRNKNMIKKISLISDTDSSFVSLDAWYNYNIQYLKDYDFTIMHQELNLAKMVEDADRSGEIPENLKDIRNCILGVEKTKDSVINGIEFLDQEYDYDFYNRERIEVKRSIDPLTIIPQDNVKFSLINIMCYILTDVINLYMLDFTKQSGSARKEDCVIMMKNEFYMTRVLLEMVKKNYASLQQLQEGNYLGGVLAVTGIESLVKSVVPQSTRDALNKILLEEILTADDIDRVSIIKRMGILEQEIYSNIMSGSKDYYKPAKIKSIDNYDNPLSVFGVRGMLLWNYVKDPESPTIDTKERNSVDIVKVLINKNSIEKLKGEFNYQYERFSELLGLVDCDSDDCLLLNNNRKLKEFKSIAIPLNSAVPKWVEILVDYRSVIVDNLSGFPLEAVGISQIDSKKVPYTNIVKL